jgi:uncharacterized protein
MSARARGRVALSSAVYREIDSVLARPKFSRFLSGDRIREIMELMIARARFVEPAERVDDCRDAKDNKYLELALAAGAEAIVTGDEDLLVLHPWRGIPILSAIDFLSWLEAGQGT